MTNDEYLLARGWLPEAVLSNGTVILWLEPPHTQDRARAHCTVSEALALQACVGIMATARAVVEQARRVEAHSPKVCCHIDCPQRGWQNATCGHTSHPSGWIGLGSVLWERIQKLGVELDKVAP